LRVKISKIGNIATNKRHITIYVLCSGQELRMDDVNVDLKGVLLLGEEKISCTVSTISKKKEGSYGLALKIQDSVSMYNLIHPYHHKSNLDFTLLLQENIAPDIFNEAGNLLESLSERTGRMKGDLLCELTSFRNFPGKRDLKLVSAKQMPVVIKKIRERLEPESHDKETIQA